MRGFTLSEVVISFLLIAAFSVVLLGALPASILGVRRENQRADAVWLARELLEQARTAGVQKLKLGPATLPPREIAGITYKLSYEVTLPSDFPFQDAYLPAEPVEASYSAYVVDVQVSWKFHNIDRQHRVRTVVNRGH